MLNERLWGAEVGEKSCREGSVELERLSAKIENDLRRGRRTPSSIYIPGRAAQRPCDTEPLSVVSAREHGM